MAAMMQMAKPGGDKDEASQFPKFDDVTKDMESKAGLFTLWSYPSSATDKDKEKLLCQIPAGLLGQNIMLSMSFSGGGFFTGFPLEEHVVRWETRDKQLLLIEPETRFVSEEGQTVSDVVRRTYPDRIRASTPILTKSAGGDPVIDLGALLKSNLADISWMSYWDNEESPMGRMGGGVNPTLSSWTKKKTFELNVEIGVELALSRMSPPGSFDKKQVHFSFWKFPQTDYSPRVADDRVGYFLSTNRDWSKPTDVRDIFNRYINRWQLEKRDSSLPMCEPKQPIIFYIEKTVPVRFRRAVRDGILEWNKAFEKIGFVNAVEVRQQTNDNEWKDLDPEDMRYSFFRWIVTGAGFAMGPSRPNPFTGQIYDADIIFDDSMVRFYEHQAARMLPSAAMSLKAGDAVLQEFLEEHPQWKRPERTWETYAFGEGDRAETSLRQEMRKRMREHGHVGCEYAEGMKQQMAVASAVLTGQPKEVIDKFLYDVIKEVVMHEVGHTLGLRHNFKASTIYSVEEIQKRRGTGEPLVGSVMDYNPALFFSENAVTGHFITPTIGPYDYWAIEYGYRPSDGSFKGPEASKSEPDGKKEEKGAELTAGKADGDAKKEVPKEVLAQLPPEIRKIVEANLGAAKAVDAAAAKPDVAAMKSMGGGGGGEKDMLDAIAARAAEPELAYASDEDTTFLSPDPRSNRFDMGSDPIDWAQARMKVINDRMKNILEWGVKDGESWYYVRQTFISLLIERVSLLDYVGRYVGGLYTARSHRGDKDAPPPFEVVEPDLQRRALSFMDEHLYRDDFSWVTPEVLNHLASPRWWHEGTQINFVVDFPIHDLIAMVQWWNMFDRFFPNTLRRMYDSEMKTVAADKFTVAEYLQRMQQACWSEVTEKDRTGKGPWTDTSPYVSSVRRSLQREYLNMMEPLVRTAPGLLMSPDLHAMVQHSLRKLNARITDMLNTGGLDFASESHLASCKSRIERMLAPELKEYEFGGS